MLEPEPQAIRLPVAMASTSRIPSEGTSSVPSRRTASITGDEPSSSTRAPASYSSTSRRPTIYGTEDRIVLDLGSRIWKVGFSGEPKPRTSFVAARKGEEGIWSCHVDSAGSSREDAERVLRVRIQERLREVFFT